MFTTAAHNKIIRLCYRKIIDVSSKNTWDVYVFESTYTEFLLQSQFYNQEKKYTSFAELILNVKGADKLHFLVSAAVTGYLQQLSNNVPDLTDNLGIHFLTFKNYQFEIIQSDIKNKTRHKVAINFFSEPLIWYDTIGDYLLVSNSRDDTEKDGVLTHLIELQPFLSIYSIKKTCYDSAIKS